MKKIVVLVSGQGSNLQSLIDACKNRQITNASIVAVFSKKAHAYALHRAKVAGIATHAMDANLYQDRADFDIALANAIDQYDPYLVVLAGYMYILSPDFVRRYSGRILNIHPSLLPKYPGLCTHRRAIENGDSEHGTSVHFVTEKLDCGPVILQAKVSIFHNDKEEDVSARIHTQEHIIYPLVVNWFITGRLTMHKNTAWLDGKCLPSTGLR